VGEPRAIERERGGDAGELELGPCAQMRGEARPLRRQRLGARGRDHERQGLELGE
jgi:hypothetical protein